MQPLLQAAVSVVSHSTRTAQVRVRHVSVPKLMITCRLSTLDGVGPRSTGSTWGALLGNAVEQEGDKMKAVSFWAGAALKQKELDDPYCMDGPNICQARQTPSPVLRHSNGTIKHSHVKVLSGPVLLEQGQVSVHERSLTSAWLHMTHHQRYRR